jgi:hypothetical protein
MLSDCIIYHVFSFLGWHPLARWTVRLTTLFPSVTLLCATGLTHTPLVATSCVIRCPEELRTQPPSAPAVKTTFFWSRTLGLFNIFFLFWQLWDISWQCKVDVGLISPIKGCVTLLLHTFKIQPEVLMGRQGAEKFQP